MYDYNKKQKTTKDGLIVIDAHLFNCIVRASLQNASCIVKHVVALYNEAYDSRKDTIIMRKGTIIGLAVAVAVVVVAAGILVGISSYNRSIESKEESGSQAVERAITSVSGNTINVGYVAFGLDGLGKVLRVGLIAEDTPTTDQIRSILKAIRASYPDDAAYLSLSIVDAQGELIDVGDRLREIGVDEKDIVNGYELSIRSSGLHLLKL